MLVLLAVARPWIATRIHVRIKAVGLCPRAVPRSNRLVFHQTYLHNRFNALKAVFSWPNQPDRRAGLWREGFSIESRRQNGQRMHGLIHPQAFHIRPIKYGRSLI